MSRCPGSRLLPFAFAVASLFTGSAAVADTGIYESAAEIEIGRVFLTPAERARLDRRRLLPPAPAGGDAVAGAPAASGDRGRQRRPAGYIVSSSGQRRDWTGDSFVASGSQSPSSHGFPGDVKIVRHTSTGADAERVVEADGQDAAPANPSPAPAEPRDNDVVDRQ